MLDPEDMFDDEVEATLDAMDDELGEYEVDPDDRFAELSDKLDMLEAKVDAMSEAYDVEFELEAEKEPVTSGGTKYDDGKPPIGLIPRCAIEEEAMVLAFGADKYGVDNWRQGFAYRRLIDAALRHVFAIADGEDYDPESGLLHAAHARCMLGFLIEHYKDGLGDDDRYVR